MLAMMTMMSRMMINIVTVTPRVDFAVLDVEMKLVHEFRSSKISCNKFSGTKH